MYKKMIEWINSTDTMILVYQYNYYTEHIELFINTINIIQEIIGEALKKIFALLKYKMVAKVITAFDSSKVSSFECIPVVNLKNCKHKPS